MIDLEKICRFLWELYKNILAVISMGALVCLGIFGGNVVVKLSITWHTLLDLIKSILKYQSCQ